MNEHRLDWRPSYRRAAQPEEIADLRTLLRNREADLKFEI
jgi:hypothetical protein